MSLVPPSTNAAYRGSPLAWQFLLLLGLVNLGRGGIHFFADDGGAGRIAGIDLAQNREVIVMLFAIMGLDQIVWGLVDVAVALRHRSLVPVVLLISLAKQAIAAAVMWLYKPLPVPAPGKFGAVLTLPLLVLALFLALREAPGPRTTG